MFSCHSFRSLLQAMSTEYAGVAWRCSREVTSVCVHWLKQGLCRSCCLTAGFHKLLAFEGDEEDDEDDEWGGEGYPEGHIMEWEDMMTFEDEMHDAYGYGYNSDDAMF